MTALEQMGRVSPGYRHVPKVARPGPSLGLDDTILKWYEIAQAEARLPAEIRELARDSLREASRAGELDLSGDLGFVILHRCGEEFYFLILSTWRNDNELWQTVWAKDGDADAAFRPWVVEGSHRPTFCVWELGAVCHEQRAWADYLRSARDEAAKRGYLQAAYEGQV